MTTTETKLTVEDLAHYYYMLRAELLHSAELRKMLDRLFVAARASLEAKGAWEPIETCPRNTKVLTARDDECEPWNICWWRDIGDGPEWIEANTGVTTVTHGTFKPPTHWMPLPLPPAPSTGTGGQRGEYRPRYEPAPPGWTMIEADRTLRRSLWVCDDDGAREWFYWNTPTQGRDAAEGELPPEPCKHGYILGCCICDAPNVSTHEQERKEDGSEGAISNRNDTIHPGAAVCGDPNHLTPNVSPHEQERKENVPEQDLELPVGVRSGQHLRNSDAQPTNLTPTGRVVPFTGITKLDLPTERIIAGAADANLEAVVVIGFDSDGDFFFSSSKADGGEVLWLMELARKKLLEIGDQ